MTKIIITILILPIRLLGYAQVDTASTIESAHIAGEKMVNSFHTGDYDTYLDFTHPKIIEMSGGREEMKSIMGEGLGDRVRFLGMTLKKPDKIIVKDSLIQCSMEQRQEVEIEGNKYSTIGTLIGISYDLGDTWYFIGVAKNSLINLKVHFPELSDSIDVKKQTPPTLIN